MSLRLLSPENRLALENLLTPVSRVNATSASHALMIEYTPCRKSRFARATSGVFSASRIGLSYSSMSTATRCPARSCRVSMRWAKRSVGES